jgi:hypothetical protein
MSYSAVFFAANTVVAKSIWRTEESGLPNKFDDHIDKPP